MKYSITLPIVLASLAYTVSALGINDADVPTACQTICRPLVQLSNACTSGSSTDSSCICDNKSFDVLSIGSACAICCQQNNKQSSDLSSVSSACSFTQGAYNQVSASSVAATIVVTATHASSTVTLSSGSPASGTAKATGSGSSKNGAPMQTMAPAGLLAAAAIAGMVL